MNLIEEIDHIRNELLHTAEQHAMNLLHPDVLWVSQKLDHLIVASMAYSEASSV
ncbi:aspartyl-phosphate phosphatase Spo0E family protein [Paenibacillus abyssi]|uniref:Spo0E like sporulation regulatory protein n=1 Tax=Paenibacillus abyssi TaxID=1340531 RepID=A0A917FSQ9_9BACL|nr:hypothetical protein GCM10010916_14620 [Paenibacillus abyssi]